MSRIRFRSILLPDHDIFSLALCGSGSLSLLLFELELFFGLQVPVGDEPVQEAAWTTGVVALLLGLIDLLADVLLGLFIGILVIVVVGCQLRVRWVALVMMWWKGPYYRLS